MQSFIHNKTQKEHNNEDKIHFSQDIVYVSLTSISIYTVWTSIINVVALSDHQIVKAKEMLHIDTIEIDIHQ